MKKWIYFALISVFISPIVADAFSGYYEIINLNSGMVLESPGWSTNNGTDMDQWHGDGNPNQQWSIMDQGSGNYEIINRNSNLALEVYWASTNNGAVVDQWSPWNGPNQLWNITDLGNGAYSMVNVNSKLALEVFGSSTSDGGGIDQWNFWYGPNQEWLLVPVGQSGTITPSAGGTGDVAANFHGFNWADPRDNYVDGPLFLSGLTNTDNYSSVESKASAVLGTFQLTGANTVRIPVNPETVIGSWWASYRGVIDQATANGMKVILGYWEGESSKDGFIDDPQTFYRMWDKIIREYNGNGNVYFEIFNEPHGYGTTDWLNVVATWLARYPTVPHGRVLVGGTGYDVDVPAVASSSVTSGCLYSVHCYGFWNPNETINSYWYNTLAGEVGSYASSTVLTECGAVMNGGPDYSAGDQNNNAVASMVGICNFCCNANMGSLYWAGLKDSDSYSMFTRNSTTTQFYLNSASGLDLVKYAWSGFTARNATGYYQIVNSFNGENLEIYQQSAAPGALADQWAFNGGNNQLWQCESLGNGYFAIINANSGLALGVQNGDTYNGAAIDQYYLGPYNSQEWSFVNMGDGFYEIINRNSGLALEDYNWGSGNGASVDQWQYNPASPGANQLWTFGPP